MHAQTDTATRRSACSRDLGKVMTKASDCDLHIEVVYVIKHIPLSPSIYWRAGLLTKLDSAVQGEVETVMHTQHLFCPLFLRSSVPRVSATTRTVIVPCHTPEGSSLCRYSTVIAVVGAHQRCCGTMGIWVRINNPIDSS
jgi:hypothetical protein